MCAAAGAHSLLLAQHAKFGAQQSGQLVHAFMMLVQPA